MGAEYVAAIFEYNCYSEVVHWQATLLLLLCILAAKLGYHSINKHDQLVDCLNFWKSVGLKCFGVVVIVGPSILIDGPSVLIVGPSVLIVGPSVLIVGPSVLIVGPSVNFYYTFQIYPDMFWQLTGIFRGLHVSYKLLQYVCALGCCGLWFVRCGQLPWHLATPDKP
jgi:hypothetical protein